MFEIKEYFKNHYYQYIYKLKVGLPIFCTLFLFDQFSKLAALKNLSGEVVKKIIPGLLNATYVINTGSAYGVNADNVGLSIFLALLGTIILTLAIALVYNKFLIIVVSLLTTGSYGNLLGRIWGPNNGVIDLLQWDFHSSAAPSLTDYTFNLADSYINIGVILLIGFVIYLLSKLIYIKYLRKNNNQYADLIISKNEDKIIVNQEYERNVWVLFFSRDKKRKEKKELLIKLKQDLKTKLKAIKDRGLEVEE